jgi:hypothetical protein
MSDPVGMGLEAPHLSHGKQPVSAHPTHNPTHQGSVPKKRAPVDPRLQTIIDRWDALSEATKDKIARWID